MEIFVTFIVVAHFTIAWLVGLCMRHAKDSVHFERESLFDALFIGLAWPLFLIVLIVGYIDYRLHTKR